MSRTPRQYDMHEDAQSGAGGAAFMVFKRGLDVIGAVVGLILFALLILCCAWWIKIVDPGHALYRQWRVGRDGWLFRIYKLRTMALDAEAEGVCYAQANDPRILPSCLWMRRSHVDELSQF